MYLKKDLKNLLFSQAASKDRLHTGRNQKPDSSSVCFPFYFKYLVLGTMVTDQEGKLESEVLSLRVTLQDFQKKFNKLFLAQIWAKKAKTAKNSTCTSHIV